MATPDSGVCTEGQTESCTCANGETGTATCTSQSEYGACVCALVDAGNNDAGNNDAGNGDAGTDAGSDAGSEDAGTDAGVDAGSPTAMFSTSPIDFGMQPCGGLSPAPIDLMVTNSGGGTLSYQAQLASTVNFAIQGGASGMLTAGQSANIVIGAGAIPASATAGAQASTTLTLTTNDPAQPSTAIQVTVTPQGGVLNLSPTHVAFPATTIDTSASPFPLTLTNTGNAPVSLAFGAATNSDFGAIYDGSDAGPADAGDAPVTLGVGATLGNLNATFTPTQPATESAVIPIVVASPVCAGSASMLTAGGTGEGGIYASDAGTDFYFGDAGSTPGFTACGSSATGAQTYTFTNTGNQSFTWQATLASTGTATGTYYSVTPSGANLLNVGASATVTITPTGAVPATSPTTTDLYADTLIISTSAPADVPHAIALHQTAYGAILAATPTNIPFGSTPATTTLTAPFTVTNSGNALANVGLTVSETDTFSTTAFSVAPAAGAVTPTAPLSTVASFTAPTGSPRDFTGTIALTNLAGGTTGLCGPLPAATTMTASSISGAVAVSPSSVFFGNSRGLVNCGTKANAMPVTVKNSGNSPYTISSSLGRGSGSPYTLTTTCSDGSMNNVAAGGSCTISVQPEAIPIPSEVTPDLYGDLLAITTSVAGDSIHYVQLNMTAQGAIFTAERDSVSFGPVYEGTSTSYAYAFTNIGNASGQIDFAPAASGSPFSWPANFQMQAGDVDRTFMINFKPTAVTNSTASLVFAPDPSSVFCKPLPLATDNISSIALSGSGSATNITMPGSVDFKKGPCGTAPTGMQPVKVTNNVTENGSGFPIYILAELPDNSLYTLQSNASCVYECTSTEQEFEIPFGTTISINVVPSPIAQNASTANHALTQALTILNDVDNGVRTVYLQNTATGAVLQFAPSTLSMFGPATVPSTTSTAGGFFYLWNTGNAGSPPLTLSLSGTNAASFVLPTGSFNIEQLDNDGLNDTKQFSTKFTAPATGSFSATATLTTTTGLTNLCQSALPSLTINATGQ